LRQKFGIRVQFELVFDGLEKQERKFYKSMDFMNINGISSKKREKR